MWCYSNPDVNQQALQISCFGSVDITLNLLNVGFHCSSMSILRKPPVAVLAKAVGIQLSEAVLLQSNNSTYSMVPLLFTSMKSIMSAKWAVHKEKESTMHRPRQASNLFEQKS